MCIVSVCFLVPLKIILLLHVLSVLQDAIQPRVLCPFPSLKCLSTRRLLESFARRCVLLHKCWRLCVCVCVCVFLLNSLLVTTTLLSCCCCYIQINEKLGHTKCLGGEADIAQDDVTQRNMPYLHGFVYEVRFVVCCFHLDQSTPNGGVFSK